MKKFYLLVQIVVSVIVQSRSMYVLRFSAAEVFNFGDVIFVQRVKHTTWNSPTKAELFIIKEVFARDKK